MAALWQAAANPDGPVRDPQQLEWSIVLRCGAAMEDSISARGA